MKVIAKKIDDWEKLSKSYSKRILTSDHILFPAVLKNIKEPRGKKIIDVGCGAGHFCNELSRRGAKVVGTDSSEDMINTAKILYGNAGFVLCPAEKLTTFGERGFDYATAIMLFLCMDKRHIFENAFKEIDKVLKIGGKLIIVDLHPCAKKSFKNKIFSQVFDKQNYFESGKPIKVSLRNREEKKLSFTDYNWTLEDYSKAIRKTGLAVTGIEEPRPSAKVIKSYPELAFFTDNPIYMLIELTKYK